jgi:hypothetical protein
VLLSASMSPLPSPSETSISILIRSEIRSVFCVWGGQVVLSVGFLWLYKDANLCFRVLRVQLCPG